MPRKKPVVISEDGFVQMARLFSGPQVRERFVYRLLHTPDIVVLTICGTEIPVDVWDKAVTNAAEATDADFKIQGLCEYRHFLGEKGVKAFMAANATPAPVKSPPEIDIFESFTHVAKLCVKGAVSKDVVKEVFDWMSPLNKERSKSLLNHVLDHGGKK